MIVNEEEALSRVNSPDNLINQLNSIKNGVVIDKPKAVVVERLPQSDGPRNIPPMVQQLIAVSASKTTQKQAAEAFGVTQSMAGEYENGNTKATRNLVKEKINTAHENALDAMVSCITHIKHKLEDPDIKIKATDLSKIAADMGRVIEKTSPKEAARTNVLVQVYAPRIKSESEFEEVAV